MLYVSVNILNILCGDKEKVAGCIWRVLESVTLDEACVGCELFDCFCSIMWDK